VHVELQQEKKIALVMPSKERVGWGQPERQISVEDHVLSYSLYHPFYLALPCNCTFFLS
jgi:hypothetical protein